MARIYVSSTFSDLLDCREQVRLTLRRMDHDDVAMEYYTAEATRPLDKCLRDVEACDLYICLVAWRYGYIPEGHDHSITELEYRRAVEAGKPCLAFLLAEDAPWPFNLVESAAIHEVQTFRRELQRHHTISFFNGVEDIGARVAEAVHVWGKSQGLVTIGGRTDWEAYRAAVFDKHRWVRLAVIAGAKQDRRFAQIPLTEVFVAQRTATGRPTYDVPRKTAETGSPQHTEPFEPPLVLEESSLQILGREPKQVILGGPGSGKSTLFHFVMLALCDPVPSEANIPAGLRNGPLPFLVEPGTPFREIVTQLAQHRVSAVPVLDAEGRVLGVVSEADLLLKQEHPDPKVDIPLIWSSRRRLERKKAAASVAGKLMTTPPVTVAPTITVTEAARRMHTAGVRRLPVVDEAGRLAGIVSRADLLKVFTRPDEDVRREVLDDVIVGQFAMDPSCFLVDVHDGVVVLQGKAERRSLIPFLVSATHAVEGVVRVENRLSFDVDDRDLGMPMTYPFMRPTSSATNLTTPRR
jgi:CBS domain-containing protein